MGEMNNHPEPKPSSDTGTETPGINLIKSEQSEYQLALKREQSELKRLVRPLKRFAIELLKNLTQSYEPETIQHLAERIDRANHLEDIVSTMSYVKGDIAVLEKLAHLKPDLRWYRAGATTRVRDLINTTDQEGISTEDLDTIVIDGGQNGLLGQPVAVSKFVDSYMGQPRREPVILSLDLPALITGIQDQAIYLGTEHFYDLKVMNNDWDKYLDFCRKYLRVEPVSKTQI